MANYATTTITKKYHDAIVDWQKKNFPELALLERNWDDYFKGVAPFELVAKVGDLKSDVIEVGQYAGRQRFERAKDMVGNAFFSARDIIKAQCSTELGSIQQHRLTLDNAVSDKGKFAVLRIMAEELRHAYQMFWVLDQDPYLEEARPGRCRQADYRRAAVDGAWRACAGCLQYRFQ